MRRLINFDLSRTDDRNAFYLVLEIFWASMLAAAASFNAAFALRLGASNSDIGFLSSVPAILAMLVSIPAGRFIGSRRRNKPWIIGSLTLYRAGFLLVALTPFLHLAGISQGTLLVFILVVTSTPANFFNVGFIPMLASVVAEDRRAAVFTARSMVVNASLSVCVFLFGQWLSRIAFPINYQIMYVFGFLTSLLSIYFLIKVQVPDTVVAPAAQTPNQISDAPIQSPVRRLVSAPGIAIKQQWIALQDAFKSSPGFLRITRNTVMHGIGLWLASPLYIVFYVKSLHATDAWIGLLGTVASIATIVGYAIWRWILTRWGEPKTLKRTIILAGVYPILVGLLGNLNLILIAVALNSLISPGINLAHLNSLMKLMPDDKRPEYTALYYTIVNFAAFICPMVGVAIAGWFGLGPTLMAFGALSILGSSSFWWWPVRKDDG
jgi:hypothetical protein